MALHVFRIVLRNHKVLEDAIIVCWSSWADTTQWHLQFPFSSQTPITYLLVRIATSHFTIRIEWYSLVHWSPIHVLTRFISSKAWQLSLKLPKLILIDIKWFSGGDRLPLNTIPTTSMGWTTSATLLAVLVLAVVSADTIRRLIRNRIERKGYPLPPGPTPLPFLGSALSVNTEEPFRTYTEWRAKYGEYNSAELECLTLTILR